ncbi:MAG: glycosyl hydrolase family 8 [Ahrensia sp.]
MLARVVAFLCVIAIGFSAPAMAASVSPAGGLDYEGIWKSYKRSFVGTDGRVIDNVNGNISHSEGQGYGMILAFAAGDRTAFEEIYAFAKNNLRVRKDKLFAWRYDERNSPAVSDKNNASDGDLLIAWALLEAAEAGWNGAYKHEALEILRDLEKQIVYAKPVGKVLLPGGTGFIDKSGNVTVNPAYWIYPAMERVASLSGRTVWQEVTETGMLLKRSLTPSFNGLVPDWVTIFPAQGGIGLSTKLSAKYGYEAIRVPIYTMWSAEIPAEFGAAIVKSSTNTRTARMELFDLRSGARDDAFRDPGYSVINHLANCVVSGRKLPVNAKTQIDINYYPATLQLLSLVAAQTRFPQCM